MSKFVGTGPSSYKNRIYRPAVSQRLRNTGLVRFVTSPVCLYEKKNGNPLNGFLQNLVLVNKQKMVNISVLNSFPNLFAITHYLS